MNISEYIDSTNLSKIAIIDDIIKLCDDAMKYHFESVCVSPYYVKSVSDYLKESTVNVCTVIGFPNGYSTKETKQYEAIDAINNGADEIDMVININALKNKDYDYIKEEIEEIRDAIDGKVLKVIIETCLLTDKEIVKMTEICNETFVNFIKTSTGFSESGAKVEDIELINDHKNEILEIKASGGIRDIDTAEAMIKAGATRLGTSSGVKLMQVECNDKCQCGHCHKEEE
jgi:deoxyribose-phosphate aldolase